jgi:1,4-alpha-glucan branching enzyme
MPKGYLALLLHAHLPFIRHPEYDEFMEESWLFEAITETYIPLLDVFEGLVRDNVDFRITMSLTPPLCAMLMDDLLKTRYERHLSKMVELANKEVHRTQHLPEFHETALMYQRKLGHYLHLFTSTYQRDLVSAFRRFQDLGKLEIVTCGATHGFFPLMNINSHAINAQIATAQRQHERIFGKKAQGIWNGECGYYPGLENLLDKHKLHYFFVDTHGVMYASKRPKYGVFAPIMTPCKNGNYVGVFGRDAQNSGKQVWSAEEGYPGDPNYRDFYRDVGYDLEFDYIQPYIHPDGIRSMTGIKYHRITGKVDLGDKQPYNPQVALDCAADHAGNFMFNREKQVEYLAGLPEFDRKPLIFAPFDAELFGHWWYEGPDFLNYLFRKMHHDQDNIALITPHEYLEEYQVNQIAQPSYSSWGYKGYAEVWLEGGNDWIYRHLHQIADWMVDLAKRFQHHPDAQPQSGSILYRALNQCAREVQLAQSSDWAFIMKTKTTVPYAVKRTKQHINRFLKLREMILTTHYDTYYLEQMEWRDNIFPDINYKDYADDDLRQ